MKSLEDLTKALLLAKGGAPAKPSGETTERDLVRRMLTRRKKETPSADLDSLPAAPSVDTGDLSRALARARLALLEKKAPASDGGQSSLAEMMAADAD